MNEIVTTTSYDGQHTLTYKDTGKSHLYHLDGVRIPGATTVGNCYPKAESLIRWLVSQGLNEYQNKTKLKEAAVIGKVFHKYAECYLKKEAFDWSWVHDAEDSQMIEACIRQGAAFFEQHPEDKLYEAELLVASPTLKVATSIDAVILRDTDVIIRDYKTNKRVYISALHQTALGRRMLREWKDVNANKLEIVKVSKDPEAIPFEWCVVDNTGLTLNGTFIAYDGLLDALEEQTIRNVGTYYHMKDIEKLLDNYYKDK